jgi:hypothetical protein
LAGARTRKAIAVLDPEERTVRGAEDVALLDVEEAVGPEIER